MSELGVRAIAGAAVVILFALFIRGYGERRYEAGRQSVIAADAKATKQLREQVAVLAAQNARLAAAAHATYEVEHAQNVIAARQPLSARELCSPANDRSERMPAASTAKPGDAAEPAAAGMVREVPPPDYGQFGDRLRLLGALAALADDGSAVIREYQAREGSAPRSLVP